MVYNNLGQLVGLENIVFVVRTINMSLWSSLGETLQRNGFVPPYIAFTRSGNGASYDRFQHNVNSGDVVERSARGTGCAYNTTRRR